MSVHLGQFFAFVLLVVCLVINIAFFAEVREPFLGEEDPTASIKSVLSELDIPARIAEFYPKIQSKVDKAGDETPPAPPQEATPVPKEEKSVSREPKRPPPVAADAPPVKPEAANPVVDPFRLPVPPLKAEPEKVEKEVPKEQPKEVPSKTSESIAVMVPEQREPNLQTAAVMPVPKPAVAAVKPVVADQFKPIITAPKPVAPVVPVKPSSSPVWDTLDTVLDRPIRYDP